MYIVLVWSPHTFFAWTRFSRLSSRIITKKKEEKSKTDVNTTTKAREEKNKVSVARLYSSNKIIIFLVLWK